MADLRSKEIKNGYPNIVTIGATTDDDPTTGTLENGKGTNLTSVTVDGSITADGAVTVNESGGNNDFRVEGDTEANLLFTDASEDRVGIGTNSPSVTLHVNGTDAIKIPVGTTAERPTGADGFIRYNSDNDEIEAYINGKWIVIEDNASMATFIDNTVDAINSNRLLFQSDISFDKDIVSGDTFSTPSSLNNSYNTNNGKFISIADNDSDQCVISTLPDLDATKAERIEQFFEVDTFGSSVSLAVGFTDDINDASSVISIHYRDNGSCFYCQGFAVQPPLARSTNVAYEYTDGDVISIDVDLVNSRFRTSLNSVYSPWITYTYTLSIDNLLTMCREGNIDFVTYADISQTNPYIKENQVDSIVGGLDYVKDSEVDGIVNGLDYIKQNSQNLYIQQDYINPIFESTIPSSGTFNDIITSTHSNLTVDVSSNILEITATGNSSDLSIIQWDDLNIQSDQFYIDINPTSIGGGDPIFGVGFANSDKSSYKAFGYRTDGSLSVIDNGSFSTPRSATVALEYDATDRVGLYCRRTSDSIFVQTVLNNVYADAVEIPFSYFNYLVFYIRGAIEYDVRPSAVNELIPTIVSDLIPAPAPDQVNTFYVSASSGSDSNDGSSSSPFATISKALTETSGLYSTTIWVEGGDYRETLGLSACDGRNISIRGYMNENIRVMGSDSLSSITKTSGYTNIYEGVFTSAVPAVLEDGRESKPIPNGERHPLHKSLSNRLPYTELSEETFDTDLATTLTNMDANAGAFYYDSVNEILYIHPTDSDDPATNGYSYEVPVRNGASCGAFVKGSLTLENIKFYYSKSRGAQFQGLQSVIRMNCGVYYAGNDGFVDDANFLIAYNDEICGARDGVNGHFDNFPSWDSSERRYGHPVHIYINQWSHDNTDDGNSHHERGQVTTIGCLYEYNQKSGIAPSNDCMWSDHNSIMRYNKGNASYGEGVEVINLPKGSNQGRGVTFIGHGTVCIGNRIGFRSRSSTSYMELHNCISRENDDYEYFADEGDIVANNCLVTTSGTSIAKNTASGGTITVNNDSQLT